MFGIGKLNEPQQRVSLVQCESRFFFPAGSRDAIQRQDSRKHLAQQHLCLRASRAMQGKRAFDSIYETVVIPKELNDLCAVIIGPGGATVKSICMETGLPSLQSRVRRG